MYKYKNAFTGEEIETDESLITLEELFLEKFNIDINKLPEITDEELEASEDVLDKMTLNTRKYIREMISL